MQVVEKDTLQFLVFRAAQPQLEEEAPEEAFHRVVFWLDEVDVHEGGGLGLIDDGRQKLGVMLPAGGVATSSFFVAFSVTTLTLSCPRKSTAWRHTS